MNELITLADVNELARPCRCEPDLFTRAVDEAQTLDILNDVGAEIFLKLYEDPKPAEIATLWNGGTYTDTSGARHVFKGLKTALCYYTYARVCRASGGVVTRFDVVTKRDDYSNSADNAKRTALINDVLACADAYKLEALKFIQNSNLFPNARVKMTNNRVKVRMIGN